MIKKIFWKNNWERFLWVTIIMLAFSMWYIDRLEVEEDYRELNRVLNKVDSLMVVLNNITLNFDLLNFEDN